MCPGWEGEENGRIMNEYSLRMERDFRTLRNRIKNEMKNDSDECIALFFLEAALDAVECANEGESAFELRLPVEVPKREWCKNCKQKGSYLRS